MLRQALAEGLSIPQLLAAATKIGSIDKYTSTFGRIFSELAIPPVLPSLLAHREEPHLSVPDEEENATDGGKLSELFSFRHHLVHEISNSIIGHPNIRDNLGIEMTLAA